MGTRRLYQKKVKQSLPNTNSSSNPSSRILSESDIPSNRLLFQLQVSAHHTAETGFGLLPTPLTTPGGRKFQPGQKRIVTKKGQIFRPNLFQLAQAGLLPTPYSERLERTTRQIIQRRNGQSPRIDSIPTWIDWPTQSPVCLRDDGLSTSLVNISFSKWRKEKYPCFRKRYCSASSC